MKSIAYALGALLAASPLAAQTWTAGTSANGSLLFGGVYAPENSLGFGCTAPAPENRPLIETGSHESHRTEAFQTTVNFDDLMFEWSMPYEIDGIVITVDDTSYQMPTLGLNELQGSAIYLPMTDPFILSLFTAQSLVLDTGQGTAYTYPVDGLADGLRTVFGHCNARWMELGNPMPPVLAAVMGGASPVPSPAVAPAAPAAQIPQFITDRVAQWCAGGGTVDQEVALGQADFDGDGLPDYIFNGLGVTCNEGINPFCGASQCSVDVHLSSRNYEIVYGWIGLDFHIGTTSDGRVGLARSSGGSGPLEVWTGSAFETAQTAAPASPPDSREAISVPPQLLVHVASICGNDYAFAGASIPLQGNLDGDGLPDYVLGWRDITCPGAGVTEYCGASHCNIDAFLSSQSYARNDVGVGPSVGLAPLTNGLDGVGTTLSGFPVLQMWDGAAWADALHLWDQSQ